MPRKRILLWSLLAYAGLFILIHGVSMIVCSAHPAAISYVFVIAAPLLAAGASAKQAWSGSTSMRFSWTLIVFSLLIWSSGMMIAAWEELSKHAAVNIAAFSDFTLCIYGVPILLAISTPARRGTVPLFVWLDGIQALMTTYLVYVVFFSVSPFAHRPVEPIGVNRLLVIYSVESVILAVSALVRVASHRGDGASFHFYRLLANYLCIYAVCIGTLNAVFLLRSGKTGYFDLFIDIPFLYLAIEALLTPDEPMAQRSPVDKRRLALFADNLSPIFFTASLFSLSVSTLHDHLYLGVFSMVISLAVYSIRTTALQSRLMRAQEDLIETQDRLRAISLMDDLTDVANRRCFDRTFKEEWDRAVRTKLPLALLMIDVDYFKRLNDEHGHLYGDRCLKRIAQAMQAELPRSGDLLARYGGEEFIVLLPTTRMTGAHKVAAHMQEAVLALKIENRSEVGLFATISIGCSVAEFPTEKLSSHLIETADAALYYSKRDGRNKVTCLPMQSKSFRFDNPRKRE